MAKYPEWVNWQQGCAIIGCGKTHFYYLVNSGKIRSKRSGEVKGIQAMREDCEKWGLRWRDGEEGTPSGNQK